MQSLETRRLTGVRKKFISGCFLFLFAVPLPAVAKTSVVLQLDWRHSSGFAGFYYALEKGFYAREGLNVTIRQGGPKTHSIAGVTNGSAQFGISNAGNLVVARRASKPVVALLASYQRSPFVFIAKSESGIRRPEDFVGKTIAGSKNLQPVLQAMMRRVNISADRYNVVEIFPTLERFAKSDIDVWGGTIMGLPVRVRAAGYKINLFFPEDYGVRTYAKVLYATDEFIENHPDTVLSMARATLLGWRKAIENIEETVGYITRYTGNGAKQETARLIASIPLIRHPEFPLGWMQHQVWTEISDMLRDSGQIQGDLEISRVYTLNFLKKIYRAGGRSIRTNFRKRRAESSVFSRRE